MSVEGTQKQTTDGNATASLSFPWEKHLTSVKIAMAKNNDAVAEELLLVLLDVAQILNTDLSLKLDLLARMGHVELRTKGPEAAKERFDDTIKLAAKHNVLDHPVVAYCLDGMADCMEAGFEFTRAEAARKRALSIAEHALGAEHKHTQMLKERLNTMRTKHKAHLYGSHVRTLFDDLLDRGPQPKTEQQASADRTEENVAGVMFDKYMTNAKREIAQKNWAAAQSALQYALEKSASFPKHDARHYDVLRMMAKICLEAGQTAEARKHYERALTEAFDNIGPYCEETAKTLELLGDSFMQQNDIVNAKNHYQQAISAYQASVGRDHSSAASVQQKYKQLVSQIDEERKWQGWSV